MKKQILKIILTLSVLSGSCQANSNNAIAGAAILGIVTAFANTNAKTYDEIIDYKSYKINQSYKITASQKFADVKGKVGIQHQYKQVLDIQKSDKYEFVLNNNFSKKDFLKELEIAKKILTATEKMMGEQEDIYYATFDKEGKLLKSDYPLLTENDIGKTFFTPAKKFTILKDTFSRELIYTGIYQDKLHVMYREYLGDMIRSPFTQNLIFDLKQSDTISIDNFKIKIIKANNNELIFKIISDTNYL